MLIHKLGCISFLVVFYQALQLVACDTSSFQSRLHEHVQSIAPLPYVTHGNNPLCSQGYRRLWCQMASQSYNQAFGLLMLCMVRPPVYCMYMYI